MKKTFFLWSLLVAAVMSICSCSSNADSLMELVPADADFVCVGDINTVVESAGGAIKDSQVKLPSWLKEIDSSKADGEISDKVKEFNDYLKKSGVNTDAIALTGSFAKNYIVFVVQLDDSKKFAKFVENELEADDKDKEDGIVFYAMNKACVAIDGSNAYLFVDNSWGRETNGKRVISNMIEEAKDDSFAKTSMAKYIAGSAFGMSVRMPRELRQELKSQGVPSDMLSIYEGYVCMKGELEKEDLVVEAKMFDDEGKARNMDDFKDLMDYKAKVSSKALSYMGKNESLVFATSLKNMKWSKYIDMFASASRMSDYQRREIGVIEDYLKNIDGTIAGGFGFTNGLESVAYVERGRNVLNNVEFSLVVETKDGKAEKVMRDLAGLMDQGRVPYEGSASKGFTIDLSEMEPGAAVYIATDGNFLIISNHKIMRGKENATVKAFDFDDYIMASACYLDKNNKLMKDLNIKNDILVSYAYDASDMEMKFKLEVKDGKGSGVLEKIANILLATTDVNFNSYWESTYERSYNEPDYYVSTVDSAAVDDYYEW